MNQFFCMRSDFEWVDGCPVMRFPALMELGDWLRHGFTLRVPGVDVGVDREVALGRLRACHFGVARSMGFAVEAVSLAEQIHGAEVAWVGGDREAGPAPGADGLATSVTGRVLGIHVADCCAVYVVDPVKRAVALAHSGRKGSELGIVRASIGRLVDATGSRPADLVVQLSPCIRPPHYEVDFAACIRRDARDCGVPDSQIHDDGTCTASDLERFYSYRAEKGRTGRMFALLGLV
jgi:copper oxidase (laccase) domain-containing protein